MYKRESNGSLVKRLRHGPLKAETGVRFSHGSPKNNLNRFIRFRLFLFKTEGLVYGINSLCELYGIAARPRMASDDRLYSPFPFVLDSIQCSALIPCSLKRDSMPQRVADYIHGFAVIKYESEADNYGKKELAFIVQRRISG